jgi:AAA+ ATPase superfamily predicted ATPase
MKNPFEYGSIVAENAFCDRREELAQLRRAVDDSQRVFMYGERRLGKTSLVKRLLEQLPKKNYIASYVDLWPTDSDSTFIEAFASALTESASTTPQKMLEFAGSFFGRLAPSITLDHEGKPEVSFSFSRARDLKPTIDEIVAAPERIAQKLNKKLVIVFDEFQQIFEYENDIVERTLRSSLQSQPNVAYIFLGSRKHVVRKMVLDKSRPFYKAGPHFSLKPIPAEEWSDFIRERFERSQKTISDRHIAAICSKTEGHPFYTQHLCHALWELTEQYTSVTDEKISQALDVLLAREDYAYSMIWESLTVSQRRLLEGLALEPPGPQVYGADFLEKYEIKTASTAQRAVKALAEREIIDLEAGQYFLVDRFFRQWIARKHD